MQEGHPWECLVSPELVDSSACQESCTSGPFKALDKGSAVARGRWIEQLARGMGSFWPRQMCVQIVLCHLRLFDCTGDPVLAEAWREPGSFGL